MLRLMIGLLLVAATVPGLAQERLAYPTVDLRGALYRAVFVPGANALTARDVAPLPDDIRARLTSFLVNRATLEKANDGTRQGPRHVLEAAILALSDREDARTIAADFLREAPLAADWGDSVAAPLKEASYAEQRLRLDAALAPFLYVFIAHRQRAAFELADRGGAVDAMKTAARKYRAVMQRARSATDPIYALLADDLDRMPYVHTKTDKHPATFNPDT